MAAPTIHLVEVTPTDQGGAPMPLTFSDMGYTTGPDDTPPNVVYAPRALVPYTFTTSLPVEQMLPTFAQTAAGDTRLANADGGLDAVLGAIWDGAPLHVLRGPADGAYADFVPVFAGLVQTIEWTLTEVTLRLRDPQELLQAPIATATYAGTGGLEGPEALTGTLKPRCYGRVQNIAPPLVSPGFLTYQVHDGPVTAIDAVYESGIPLVPVTGRPTLGEYIVSLATGSFILGFSPVGIITADVVGVLDDGTGTAVERRQATRILRKLLADAYPTVARDDASFLAEARGGEAGLYLTERRTLLDLLPPLLSGQGSALVFTALGVATVITPRFDSSPVAVLDPATLLELERQAAPPPAWRLQLGYAENYTVLTGAQVAADSDLPGGVDDARRQALGLPRQVLVQEDAAVKALHLFAADPPVIPTALATIDPTEAARLFALVSTARGVYRVKAWMPATTLQVGQLLTLVYTRAGLADGMDALVVRLDRDATSDAVRLEVLG